MEEPIRPESYTVENIIITSIFGQNLIADNYCVFKISLPGEISLIDFEEKIRTIADNIKDMKDIYIVGIYTSDDDELCFCLEKRKEKSEKIFKKELKQFETNFVRYKLDKIYEKLDGHEKNIDYYYENIEKSKKAIQELKGERAILWEILKQAED